MQRLTRAAEAVFNDMHSVAGPDGVVDMPAYRAIMRERPIDNDCYKLCLEELDDKAYAHVRRGEEGLQLTVCKDTRCAVCRAAWKIAE